MSDHENSNDIILAKLEENFRQLIEAVNEIKESLRNQMVKISDLDREILTLEMRLDQEERDIDKLKEKHDANRKWLLGIVATIIGGLTLAVIKILIGI